MIKLQYGMDDYRKTIPEEIETLKQGLISEIDILEMGTPMFCRWGLEGLRQLRNAFPQKSLLVDMKLADGGEKLVSMAIDNGANIITISGQASKAVLIQATQTAHARGAEIFIDFGFVENVAGLTHFCEEINVDYLGYGLEPLSDGNFSDEKLKIISREKKNAALAFAGGVTPENASDIIEKYHPEVLISARGIFGAEDPLLAAKKIRSEITKHFQSL